MSKAPKSAYVAPPSAATTPTICADYLYVADFFFFDSLTVSTYSTISPYFIKKTNCSLQHAKQPSTESQESVT
jgi:hypothetical protein